LLRTSEKGIFAKQVSSSMRLNQCEGSDVSYLSFSWLYRGDQTNWTLFSV